MRKYISDLQIGDYVEMFNKLYQITDETKSQWVVLYAVENLEPYAQQAPRKVVKKTGRVVHSHEYASYVEDVAKWLENKAKVLAEKAAKENAYKQRMAEKLAAIKEANPMPTWYTLHGDLCRSILLNKVGEEVLVLFEIETETERFPEPKKVYRLDPITVYARHWSREYGFSTPHGTERADSVEEALWNLMLAFYWE